MANALYTYYASPVTTVVEDPEYQDEMGEYAIDILYNQAQDVPSQAYLNLSPEALSMQNILWEELKAKSSIGNGIYILPFTNHEQEEAKHNRSYVRYGIIGAYKEYYGKSNSIEKTVYQWMRRHPARCVS
jgi:hypothetical protein